MLGWDCRSPSRGLGGRTALVVVAVLCALWLVLLRAERPAGAPARAPEAVTLKAGDTIWGLAQRYAPERVDPRAYVDEIISLNDLRQPPLSGQRIWLPNETHFLGVNP